MFKYKLSQKFIMILGVIGFGLLISSIFVSQGQAESDSESSTPMAQESSTQAVEEESIFEPVSRGAPTKTTDGGARGHGCGVEIKLLADANRKNWQLTISENPTFLWHFQPLENSVESHRAKVLIFGLIDVATGESNIKNVALPTQGGIMSLTLLPEDGFATLENGKLYEWFVASYKTEVNGSNECPIVFGAIDHRVLTAQKQQELDRLTTAEERWQFYSQHQIWYDALATLEQLRRENPEDPTLKQQWTLMLESVGLRELADRPLLESTQIARDLEEPANP